MANRVAQSPDVDTVTAAFKRVSLGAPTSRSPSGSPHIHSIPGTPPVGMAARRNKPVFKLSDITGGQDRGGGPAGAGSGAGTAAHSSQWPPRRPAAAATSTPFANFGKIVYASYPSLTDRFYSSHYSSDPSGALNFSGKAILHSSGVDFSNGPSFAINMNQLLLGEELGSGAYGTVKRVLHKPTNVAMAMKVSLSSATVIFSTPLSLTLFTGNPLGARQYQTKCDYHGTRHSTPRRTPFYRRILRRFLYRILCLLLHGVHGRW